MSNVMVHKQVFFSHHYFISYDSEDLPFTEVLERRLCEKSRSCWYDRKSIRPGRFYSDDISVAVEQCQQLIVLVSAHSNQSDWVKHELGLILNDDPLNLEGRVIPVRIDPSPLPSALKNLQVIDAIDGIGGEEIVKILSALPVYN